MIEYTDEKLDELIASVREYIEVYCKKCDCPHLEECKKITVKTPYYTLTCPASMFLSNLLFQKLL